MIADYNAGFVQYITAQGGKVIEQIDYATGQAVFVVEVPVNQPANWLKEKMDEYDKLRKTGAKVS